MLCEKRFAPDTRYMVEFLVLKQTEKFGEAGIYHRYFLTKKAYYEMVELQNRESSVFKDWLLFWKEHCIIFPSRHFFETGVGRTMAGKKRMPAGARLRGARVLSLEFFIEQKRREW